MTSSTTFPTNVKPDPQKLFDTIASQVTCRADQAAQLLGVGERTMRRALDTGGDLEHLSLRVGRRQLVKVQALLALVGAQASGVVNDRDSAA